MLSDREEFINVYYLGFTKKKFIEIFGESLKFISEDYSNDSAGMGFFELVFRLTEDNYNVIFEYERLLFTIRIEKEENFCNLFGQHRGIKNTLNEKNIEKAIKILKSDISNKKLIFYKLKKNGQIIKSMGD